jgi:diguanylate cyclase (GGDEF)-like protein
VEVEPGIRSELCVPLKVGERILGVINAENAQLHAFTEADETIMLTLAGQLAMAIDRIRAETELNRLASVDELTGLYNRRSFFTIAERELKRDQYSRRMTCLIMLDIDHFKQVNDTFGHQVGDRVLKELANCCRRNLRESDLIGRYGGEEFSILLPGTHREGARMVAERLRADVEKCSLNNACGCPQITISVGVAQSNGDSHDLSALLNKADKAMYAAKHLGRNRVVVAGEEAP